MENKDKPAYPVLITDQEGSTSGLTKREMFAMAAMQGILSGNHGARIGHGVDHICSISIKHADELLKQLESKPL